jgi:hypothetical protein
MTCKKINMKAPKNKNNSKWIYSICLVAVIVIAGFKGWNCRNDTCKTPTPFLAATRALPANHQLIQGDVLWILAGNKSSPLTLSDTFPGRHLLVSKKEGEAIRMAETAIAPFLPPDKDKAILSLSLNPTEAILSQQLQPGDQIAICIADTNKHPCSNPATVVALHTSTNNAPGNFVWLQVPQQEITAFNLYTLAENRTIWRLK